MCKLVAMKVVHFIIVAVFLGCSFLMVSCAKEEPENEIVVSTVFTPNEDGRNDVFEVTSSCGTKVVGLKIYTRAGVLVFSIEAQRCRWDGYSLSGQPLANGVYCYMAEIIDSSPKITKTGFFYLYR